ncbi:MAG: hypothetical protein LBB11_02770 [Puniceicoccales bacterium]|nr:hypothetical protein [Puniceicoccales bacterium]
MRTIMTIKGILQKCGLLTLLLSLIGCNSTKSTLGGGFLGTAAGVSVGHVPSVGVAVQP